ncbi:hypothetical protein BpHYR1_030526, partial [Brachionus plicatilis]
AAVTWLPISSLQVWVLETNGLYSRLSTTIKTIGCVHGSFEMSSSLEVLSYLSLQKNHKISQNGK